METLFTLKEVAETLRVSEETIVRAVKRRELTGIKVGGQWRFTEEGVKEYLDGRSIFRKKSKPIDVDKLFASIKESLRKT